MRAERPKHPKRGYVKIEKTCLRAERDGYDYAWVDTCCINNESSAELSEAINSMWRYYLVLGRCYVYLEDVQLRPDFRKELFSGTDSSTQAALTTMRGSRWFTRGWTLQELIAPAYVKFYDANWGYIGGRQQMSKAIALITSIDPAILCEPSAATTSVLDSYSIAARMAWAANRVTSRREDRAYSLLGIFNIHMPLLYGEDDAAFLRLQEEIIRTSDDQSILAWQCELESYDCAVLALSPDQFSGMSKVVCGRCRAKSPSQMTNIALEIELPVIKTSNLLLKDERFVVLNCRFEDDFRGPLALCVAQEERKETERVDLTVRPHWSRRAGGGRIRVMSNDDAVQAVSTRCSLHPHFSTHDHDPRERIEPSRRRFPWRRIFVCTPITGAYEFSVLGSHPKPCWTDSGLLRMPVKGKLMFPQWRQQTISTTVHHSGQVSLDSYVNQAEGREVVRAYCIWQVRRKPLVRAASGVKVTSTRASWYLKVECLVTWNTVQIMLSQPPSEQTCPLNISEPHEGAYKRDFRSDSCLLSVGHQATLEAQVMPQQNIMGEELDLIKITMHDESMYEGWSELSELRALGAIDPDRTAYPQSLQQESELQGPQALIGRHRGYTISHWI